MAGRHTICNILPIPKKIDFGCYGFPDNAVVARYVRSRELKRHGNRHFRIFPRIIRKWVDVYSILAVDYYPMPGRYIAGYDAADDAASTDRRQVIGTGRVPVYGNAEGFISKDVRLTESRRVIA
jgi:hypothetical protein